MFSLVAAIASTHAYVAPAPLRRHPWYRDGDTPPAAFTLEPLTVGSALTVRPDGRVEQCRTSVSSGYPEIDDYTCQLLVMRARLAPARAPDGTPMYGVIRHWTVWGRTEGDTFNFELTVNKLPAGIKSGARVDIAFLVDSDGHPSSCTDENNDDHPALVEIACQQLARSMETPAAVTEKGVAVPSVQDATVAFVVK